MNNSCEVINLSDVREKRVADLADGYLRLANEIQDYMCRVNLSGREFRVLNAVIRLTYGWGRKEDWITNSQISDLTEDPVTGDRIESNHVGATLRNLAERNVINLGGGHKRKIGVNKEVSEWNLRKRGKSQLSQKRDEKIIPKTVMNNPENGTELSRKRDTPKTKDNITKNNTPISPSKPVKSAVKKPAKQELDYSDIPSWLPVQLVVDFASHRESIKSPLSQNALNLIISKLAKFKAAGHNPAECLEDSIMNGWKGVFEPKGNSGRQVLSMGGSDTSWINDMGDML